MTATPLGDQKTPRSEDTGEAASSLASLLEASSDAIYTQDPSGFIRSWNRGAERLFGYPVEEAVGRRTQMLFPVQLRDETQELEQRVLAGEVVEQLETEVSRRDGMLVPVSLNLSPIRDRGGHISGATVVARDITEQNLALDTLAESDAKLQEAQALAHVGIWIWDATTSEVQWSDELYRIHGVNPMDFDGTYEGHLATIAPEDRERVDRAVTA